MLEPVRTFHRLDKVLVATLWIPTVSWLLIGQQISHINRQTSGLIHLKHRGYSHHDTISPILIKTLVGDAHKLRHYFIYLHRYWRMCQRPLSKFWHLHGLCQWIQLCMRGWLWRHSLWNGYVIDSWKILKIFGHFYVYHTWMNICTPEIKKITLPICQSVFFSIKLRIKRTLIFGKCIAT